MTPEEIEEQLMFSQAHPVTVEFQVTFRGVEVALVSNRVIALPPYVARWPDGTKETLPDRDAVVARLAEKVREKAGE